ncbi:MAG: hypothetical protein ABI585_08440 [Betaproteobacteria bacterium]
MSPRGMLDGYDPPAGLGLGALLIAGFGVLPWMERDMHQQMPPMPERVVASNGQVVFTRVDMESGRQARQSIGGPRGPRVRARPVRPAGPPSRIVVTPRADGQPG